MDLNNAQYAIRFMQQNGEVTAGDSLINAVVGLFLTALALAGLWKVFTKAGQEGWAAIVPFYNLYVLLKIVGRPNWWMILFFIPFVNFIYLVLVLIDLAKSFGKDAWYGLGVAFLPFTFLPILGFGDAQYAGPAGAETQTMWAPNSGA